jgi:hypothetical protein
MTVGSAAPDIQPAVVRVSVRHGQKTDQLPQDDLELSDLGWRGVYVAAVRTAGALRMADLLVERFISKVYAAKKMAPLLGPSFKEAKLVGKRQERRCKLPFRQPER